MKLSLLPKAFVTAFTMGLWITTVGFAEPSPTPPPIAEPIVTVTTTTTTTPDINQSSGRIWNLQDADIISVINEVSQETGKNFVIDPRVNGKITLISSKPLKKGEVYQVFLSIIGMLGYSAVPSGNVVKILPNMESGEQATPVVSKSRPGRGEEVVVRVIPLENVSATQLIPILRPLLPQWSNISTYAPGNVLILLGRANNLDRILRIILDVDKAASSGIQIVPLKRASAVQVAAALNNLQNAARAAGEAPGVSIAVDERSNSILLGGPKAMRLRMRVLISQLDSTTTTPSGNTEVIYLRYLQAKTFAPILAKIAQNISGKDSGHYDAASLSQSVTNSSSTTTVKETTSSSISSSYIQAEPNTNAIIITAPPSLMVALKTVIAKLDIRPAEVLVEAIIAEVDETHLRSLGIQWGSVGRNGELQLGGEGSAITSFPPLGAGIVGLKPATNLRIVLSALENMNGVDILSTPSITVLDNQKAAIEIGQDVPYQTGSYTTPTGTNSQTTLQPFNTFQSKPVTLKLEVTPQINLSHSVRLKIKLKNDSLQNPQNPGLTPIINTSKIENSVIVNSDDILVLGGLISNANNENVNKVPILGDVPVIGPLFTQRSRNVSKKVLMVFLKPIIIHNHDEALSITHVKYNTMRITEGNFRDNMLNMPRESPEILLPPWKNQDDIPKPFEVKPICPDGHCEQ